jgi:hypothetical protein
MAKSHVYPLNIARPLATRSCTSAAKQGKRQSLNREVADSTPLLISDEVLARMSPSAIAFLRRVNANPAFGEVLRDLATK